MPRSDIFHGISFPPCFARRDLSTPLLFGNCAIRFVGEDEVGLFAVPATDTELSPIFVLLFESVSVRDLCFGSLRRVLFPQDNMRADAHRVVSSTIVYILHIRKGFLLQRGCLSYKHSPVLRCERKCGLCRMGERGWKTSGNVAMAVLSSSSVSKLRICFQSMDSVNQACSKE